MLPAEPARAPRLTEVLPLLIQSVAGAEALAALRRAGAAMPARRLRSASAAVVVLVDGLGSALIDAHRGHARFLAAAKGAKDVAVSTFPTTTATALTSLFTARGPAAHGIMGYRVRDPERGVVTNQLSGWEHDGLDPLRWPGVAPLWQTPGLGIRPVVVSKPEYANSGFTAATLRGAEICSAASIEDRLARAAHEASVAGTLCYAYVPELDAAGHRHGVNSDAWVGTLERIDAALRGFAAALPAHVGAIVTADHGMLDVPQRQHVLFDGALVDGVAAVAGEPRMLHLYAEAGAAPQLAAAWREAESSRAWVLERDEAFALGLFDDRGPVAGEAAAAPTPAPRHIRERVGDVLVAARSAVAYYDARESDDGARHLIGQHGSLTSAERLVPFVPLGAFARTR